MHIKVKWQIDITQKHEYKRVKGLKIYSFSATYNYKEQQSTHTN